MGFDGQLPRVCRTFTNWRGLPNCSTKDIPNGKDHSMRTSPRGILGWQTGIRVPTFRAHQPARQARNRKADLVPPSQEERVAPKRSGIRTHISAQARTNCFSMCLFSQGYTCGPPVHGTHSARCYDAVRDICQPSGNQYLAPH